MPNSVAQKHPLETSSSIGTTEDILPPLGMSSMFICQLLSWQAITHPKTIFSRWVWCVHQSLVALFSSWIH